MSSAENNRQQPFPAIPPSLSAGDHEMRDYYANPSAPRPVPNQTPYLTPYLGLRARLSQVWINRWTVLLILVLVRVLFAISSTGDGLTSARGEALSACTNVEKIGSAMASMPHYMSQGVNKMTALGIDKAVNGLMSMVSLSVAGVEEIVVFVIGMMTNTYLCLITLAVSGSLKAAVDLLTNAQNDLNGILGGIGNDIDSTAKTLQNGLNGLVSGINTFTGNSVPKIDFTKQIDAIKNVKLPADLNDNLKKLNDSIPNFADVKNVTETVIRFPFEELKKTISTAMGKYEFNQSLFPVPKKEALTFCSGNNGINDFFDDLDHVAHIAKKVFIGVLLTAAILVCVPMAWLEIRRYRRLQERAKNVREYALDPMDAVYISSRPYTSDIGRWFARKFSTPRRQILVRWAVAYPTSVPALFILSLAIAGLLSCLCQYILLRAIEKQVPALTGQVANFTSKVVTQLNNASVQWADGTNKVILSESNSLNQDLFSWVNVSTKAVNDTLNSFVDETTKVLNSTFGGTPLYEPIKGVFDCLVGLKIQGVEKGLTWVHDNAHINFPLLNNDTFSLGAIAKMTDGNGDDELLSDPTGKAKDEVSNAILKVTNAIAKGIRQEALISTVILVIWLLMFFISVIYTAVRFAGYEKVRGNAGNEYAPRDVNNELPFARPASAAPPYTTANLDVNTNAPYTLNRHPLPQHHNEFTEVDISPEKHAAQTTSSVWPHQQNQNQSLNNEKSGFI
jgi:uncharacterized protein YdhG (YjbR/CyaY superfamily)